tara:strand:- start:178 stop:345 length:168 start_codon:yes stop_codon:yes gene_type:complete
MIKVKMILTLSLDEEEYPVPSDGKVGEEIEEHVRDLIHEVDGLRIRHIRTITEEK